MSFFDAFGSLHEGANLDLGFVISIPFNVLITMNPTGRLLEKLIQLRFVFTP